MPTSFHKDLRDIAAILLLCSVLFGFQLGRAGLLDPDEPFYALSAKEMVQSQDPWTPRLFGQPQFEKPILFYWVLYASFKAFGIHEWSARLGPAVAGALTVLVVYLWGRVLYRRRSSALLAAAVLASAGQFVVLSRVVLTDMFLCLFVTAAWALFTIGWRYERHRAWAWHAFFVSCALGFLTKGPLGILIPLSGIASFALFSGERAILGKMPWVSGLALFTLIGLPWYAAMAKIHGAWFWKHVFLHENIRRFFVAEHTGMDRWHFYPFVFLLGFFPWSGTALAALWEDLRRRSFVSYCFWVPFIFFMLAKSKLMSYIFPVYPAAALLCGDLLARQSLAWRAGFKTSKILLALQTVTWGVVPPVLVWGAMVYSSQSGMDLKGPILAITLTWVPLSWAALGSFWRRKLVPAMAFCVTGIAVFACLAFGWMMPAANGTFSTQDWAASVTRAAKASPDIPIFASKMYVRGLSYYGDERNMAVFSGHPRGDFYTPPMIPIFSDVAAFLNEYRDRLPAFLFIRPKEYKHLTNHLSPGYAVHVVEKGPQRMLVRLDHA